MLMAEEQASLTGVEAYKGVSGWSSLPASLPIDQLEEILASASDPAFPGAILPAFEKPNRIAFYCTASDPIMWRWLRPYLVAFAGPTLTGFAGVPSTLDAKHPVEQWLDAQGFEVVARLEPPLEQVKFCIRALARLRQMFVQRPTLTDTTPEPTSRLLARFHHSLNVGDRADVELIQAQLAAELRIDALNLHFLEVQKLAAFGDWGQLRNHDSFGSLCYARRPPAVTAALLEAVYQQDLVPVEAASALDPCLKVYRERIGPLVRDLISVFPAQASVGLIRLAALEAISTGRIADETLSQIRLRQGDLGLYREAFLARFPEEHPKSAVIAPTAIEAEPAKPDESSAEPPAQPPQSHAEGMAERVEKARQALFASMVTEALAVDREAFDALQTLTSEERAQVLSSRYLQSAYHDLHIRLGEYRPPRHWRDWLAAIEQPGFTSAQSVAERGTSEWPVHEVNRDSDEIHALSNALDGVPGGIARSRLEDALPFLVRWVQQDELFPRPSLLPVYSSILTAMAFAGHRSTALLDSALSIVDAMLECGPPKKLYTDTLECMQEFIQPAAGSRTIHWLIGVMEVSLAHPSPATELREQLWVLVLSALRSVRTQLTVTQRRLLSSLTETLGWVEPEWTIPAPEAAPLNAIDTALRQALAGKLVGIYTLTESSARQAEGILRESIPGVKVTLAHDKDGSTPLRALAENADVFVMVTGSAKHAATDFIRTWRAKNRPLLYARGKGASSILRALEEYAGG